MQRERLLVAVMAASLSVGVSSAAIGAAAADPIPAAGAGSAGAGSVGALARAVVGVRFHGRDGAASATPAAVALGAPIAPMTVHDAKGDADFPQGDLTGVGVLQNSSGTGLGVTVNLPANPAVDANWLAGNVFVVWALDTNDDGQLDRIVELGDTLAGKLIAEVLDPTFSQLYCSATATYVPKVGYRASVPVGCLPHMTKARFGAFMVYSNDLTNATADFAPDNGLSSSTSVQEASHASGYWMLGADGHVYPFGGAVGFSGAVAGAEAMAPRSDGKGYWVVDFAGHVYAYGTARFYGGTPPLEAGEFVSTISATATGGGYWLFTNRGRAFPFGNAGSFGDMSGAHLNGPIIASVATPTGDGYYMVGSDGGIFSFGDARFHGSTGGMRLNQPIVGISPTADGKGYWLVGSDGGVFAFNAPFRGSMGGTRLNQSVDGLVAFGNGYLMAASDGGIFDFSNKPFLGSLADHPPSSPIIGLAAFSN